jgi:hypothetical protein
LKRHCYQYYSLMLFDSEELTQCLDNSPIDSAPTGDCITLDQWRFSWRDIL